MLRLILSALTIALSLGALSCGDYAADGESTTDLPNSVPYTIAQEWSIPNGGYGRIVVVDTFHLNDSGMEALGAQLKYDTKDDRNAFIQVFSDARAVQMRQKVLDERATAAEQRFFDKHVIGSYTRNANTGFHAFEYSLGGVQGEVRRIKYESALRP